MAKITITGDPEKMLSYPTFRLAKMLDIDKKTARAVKGGKPITVDESELVTNLVAIGAFSVTKAAAPKAAGGKNNGHN